MTSCCGHAACWLLITRVSHRMPFRLVFIIPLARHNVQNGERPKCSAAYMLVKKPCNSFYNFAHFENFKRRLGNRIGDKVEHMSDGVMRAFVLSLGERVVL